MLTKMNLNHITAGMPVYDKDDVQVGTVRAFHRGAGTLVTADTDMVSIANAVSECLDGRDDLTPLMYARLYDQGFICIDHKGEGNVIVFPNQVNELTSEAIYLNLEVDELLNL